MKKSFWKEHATSSCIGATDEDIHDGNYKYYIIKVYPYCPTKWAKGYTFFFLSLSNIFDLYAETVLYLLASHHFRSAVDNHQLVELCGLYRLSDHLTVRIAGDLS